MNQESDFFAYNLPLMALESTVLNEEEYTETVVETPVSDSDGNTAIILGVFLPPFLIIIFLISVILVLALKKV